MLLDSHGEKLYVGEDLVAVGIPRVLKEAEQQVQEEEMLAYMASNPTLAIESNIPPEEIEGLIRKYRDPEYLQARDAQFNVEDRESLRARVEIQRAQSEVARRQRLSQTYRLTYEEAERMHRRSIRQELAAMNGQPPSQRQVDAAYQQFVDDMEASARRGAMDRTDRNWKADVQRAQARSAGRSYAIGSTGLGETTQEKVRRRSGSP